MSKVNTTFFLEFLGIPSHALPFPYQTSASLCFNGFICLPSVGTLCSCVQISGAHVTSMSSVFHMLAPWDLSPQQHLNVLCPQVPISLPALQGWWESFLI